MCRYCLASPPSIADNTHQVRLIIGNGLRPQIWEDFTKRFNIKKVAEFYGATEGNANMSKKFERYFFVIAPPQLYVYSTNLVFPFFVPSVRLKTKYKVHLFYVSI